MHHEHAVVRVREKFRWSAFTAHLNLNSAVRCLLAPGQLVLNEERTGGKIYEEFKTKNFTETVLFLINTEMASELILRILYA